MITKKRIVSLLFSFCLMMLSSTGVHAEISEDQKQELLKIKESAQEGKMLNCPYALNTPIGNAFKEWGERDYYGYEWGVLTQEFCALLLGRNEVPPVQTDASGGMAFKVDKKGRLLYKLYVDQLNNFTQASLYLGEKDENGPAVAFLVNDSSSGVASGVTSLDSGGLVEGVITKKDLIGPLEGKTVRDLVRLIKQGKIYTNVHTMQNPDGEIRGQVQQHCQ